MAVDPEVVNDLFDLVRRVHGRASLEGSDSLHIPVPDGVSGDSAYRELRALVESWELRHPEVRARIVTPARQVVSEDRSLLAASPAEKTALR
jgi:hypothetical protein